MRVRHVRVCGDYLAADKGALRVTLTATSKYGTGFNPQYHTLSSGRSLSSSSHNLCAPYDSSCSARTSHICTLSSSALSMVYVCSPAYAVGVATGRQPETMRTCRTYRYFTQMLHIAAGRALYTASTTRPRCAAVRSRITITRSQMGASPIICTLSLSFTSSRTDQNGRLAKIPDRAHRA